jgi:hypothetical protein
MKDVTSRSNSYGGDHIRVIIYPYDAANWYASISTHY